MTRFAILAEGLSKKYIIGHEPSREPYRTLRDTVTKRVRDVWKQSVDLLLRRSSVQGTKYEEFWALKDVSFEINQGDVVGIIGRNGAGKSTLLKILSRITEPSAGKVSIRGQVASLLEVGTGFHPELTGRENIFLNGAILGMSRRDIRRQLDEIVAFAGVEQHVDTPVKRYSSGMYLRLAFAISAHLRTDCILVDEVLAVGDAEFQKRCLGKMGEISREGRTVLFVSHNLGAVAHLCPKGILLNNGMLVCLGSSSSVISTYVSSITNCSDYHCRFDVHDEAVMQVLELRAVRADGQPTGHFDIADDIRLRIRYAVRELTRGANIVIILHRLGVDLLSTFDTDSLPELLVGREVGEFEYEVALPRRLFKAGLYTVTVGCGFLQRQTLQLHRDAISFRIEALSEDTTARAYSETRVGMLLGPLGWRAIEFRQSHTGNPVSTSAEESRQSSSFPDSHKVIG